MSEEFKVTVRVSAKDPFAGLKAHDYIAARGLTPKSMDERHHCEICRQAELLPAVLNIIEGWRQ